MAGGGKPWVSICFFAPDLVKVSEVIRDGKEGWCVPVGGCVCEEQRCNVEVGPDIWSGVCGVYSGGAAEELVECNAKRGVGGVRNNQGMWEIHKLWWWKKGGCESTAATSLTW